MSTKRGRGRPRKYSPEERAHLGNVNHARVDGQGGGRRTRMLVGVENSPAHSPAILKILNEYRATPKGKSKMSDQGTKKFQLRPHTPQELADLERCKAEFETVFMRWGRVMEAKGFSGDTIMDTLLTEAISLVYLNKDASTTRDLLRSAIIKVDELEAQVSAAMRPAN